MTPCVWTFHTFYHFCPSNGHQNLSLLQFVSDWHFQSIKLGTIGTILTNIRLCYYWAVPSWSRNLPLSFLNSLRPDVQTLKTELIHFPCLLQYWNDHFKNNSTDLSPQFFSCLYILMFLVVLRVCYLFCSSDGIRQKTVIDLPFMSSLPIISSPRDIFQHFSNVFSF